MIITPTVFVFGAGVSHAYGFPTASGLVDEIANQLKKPDSLTFRQVALASGESDERLLQFRKELLQSRRSSVDLFVESRRDYLQVGKLAIIRCLIPCEAEDSLDVARFGGSDSASQTRVDSPPEDFYQYLLDHLISGSKPESFLRNRLTVVTFNFDRSFERALFLALRASYGLDDDKVAQLASHVPVIHVHGDLGAPSWLAHDGWARPYDKHVDLNIMLEAAKRITLVGEEVEKRTLKPALDAIRAAKRICFLGFGFHRTNLERLRIPPECRDTELYQGKGVFGTTFGLTSGELHAIKPAFKDLGFYHDPGTAKQFVRQVHFLHEG